jgi:hypothetical protein
MIYKILFWDYPRLGHLCVRHEIYHLTAHSKNLLYSLGAPALYTRRQGCSFKSALPVNRSLAYHNTTKNNDSFGIKLKHAKNQLSKQFRLNPKLKVKKIVSDEFRYALKLNKKKNKKIKKQIKYCTGREVG